MKAFIAKILSLSLPTKIGVGFATVLVAGGIIVVPIVMSNQNPTEEEVLAQVEEYVETTEEPTQEATVEPTVEPTEEPTTEETTTETTVEPTVEPTTEAIVEPTAEPSQDSMENTNEVIDVSGYGRNDYVPGPYNLSVDANGIPDGADYNNFGGDKDAADEWGQSWSLKKVWVAPNGKMVKLKNKVPMSGETWEMRMASYEYRADNDIYGTMGSDAEASKAADYWCFGEDIDVKSGSGQSQNLPSVTKATSWCMDGSDVDSRFGSAQMQQYDEILSKILFKMRNPNEEPSGNERGTYGVKYDPTHVSMVAFMSKAFEFRFFGDYINIQLYKDPNEVDWQVFHDYLNLLTPIGDTIYNDIHYDYYEGLQNKYTQIMDYDTWYDVGDYSYYCTDSRGEEYIEWKIKP